MSIVCNALNIQNQSCSHGVGVALALGVVGLTVWCISSRAGLVGKVNDLFHRKIVTSTAQALEGPSSREIKIARSTRPRDTFSSSHVEIASPLEEKSIGAAEDLSQDQKEEALNECFRDYERDPSEEQKEKCLEWIRAGATGTYRKEYWDRPVLFRSLEYPHAEELSLEMIRAGADINCCAKSKFIMSPSPAMNTMTTLFGEAIMWQRWKVVEELIDRGVDYNAKAHDRPHTNLTLLLGAMMEVYDFISMEHLYKVAVHAEFNQSIAGNALCFLFELMGRRSSIDEPLFNRLKMLFRPIPPASKGSHSNLLNRLAARERGVKTFNLGLATHGSPDGRTLNWNIGQFRSNNTPLIFLIDHCPVDRLFYFIQSALTEKADFNIQNWEGKTAFSLLVERAIKDETLFPCVEVAISAGKADLDVVVDGRTAKELLANSGYFNWLKRSRD